MNSYLTHRNFVVSTGKMEAAGVGPDGEPRFRAGSREIPAGSIVTEAEIGGRAEVEIYLADGIVSLSGRPA